MFPHRAFPAPRSADEAARAFLLGFTDQPNTLRSYARVLD